ncbi:MAG: hypothetical protein WD737_06550 [Gemmatimonadota bacterium]
MRIFHTGPVGVGAIACFLVIVAFGAPADATAQSFVDIPGNWYEVYSDNLGNVRVNDGTVDARGSGVYEVWQHWHFDEPLSGAGATFDEMLVRTEVDCRGARERLVEFAVSLAGTDWQVADVRYEWRDIGSTPRSDSAFNQTCAFVEEI